MTKVGSKAIWSQMLDQDTKYEQKSRTVSVKKEAYAIYALCRLQTIYSFIFCSSLNELREFDCLGYPVIHHPSPPLPWMIDSTLHSHYRTGQARIIDIFEKLSPIDSGPFQLLFPSSVAVIGQKPSHIPDSFPCTTLNIYTKQFWHS